tara:strand:- start:3740 stop:4540 length:801 start_codon:yes stop_codon:yes gene_type:complete
MDLQLKKFNPETIADNRVCVFIGKRNTGKTVLVTDIMYHKRHIPAGVVMSGTEDGNSYYGQFAPDLFIYNDYNSDAVDKIILRQKKLAKQKALNNNVFILIDDCMYDKKMMRDKLMRAIFMNGRHWNIFFMLTMQYCMDIGPDLRSNIDYVFVLRENIIQNREKIYKNFFGIFPNFEMFNQIMNACTENFECLVLDNTSRSNKIEDVVFWYKAKLHPPGTFRIGAPQFWETHKAKYNPKHDDEQYHKLDTNKTKKKENVLTIKKIN